MEPLLQGFFVTSGLIIAIGAQNAFVLKQGLLKQNILAVILTCFICDIVLISLGVLGLGSLISQNLMATVVLAFLGATFLLFYGLKAFLSAYHGDASLTFEEQENTPQRAIHAVIATLLITLLNPHVYLDTVVILGGIAGTLAFQEKILFLIGALCVSALWFFSLGYGARLLIPFFRRPITWRILDLIIGVIMWAIAISLIHYGVTLLKEL
ncbi:LysE/ArgO family amino acid transporter [Pasteurella canis]|uniref:Amino acid transporter n=1 Tax=Pasteurella canis TaxID=753 RepID=A0A379EXE7_9PAST|nr:LysE/ArgO family amino acid transporter [Pasteurella canis]MXN89487.1 LysE family transporter [Pasteurella canis]UAX41962.1 LysE/ArgO family amino acid transporter [Pasteurella canis]UAY77516.1 LysE/ArgO family amino acid transporter [Pasteurella canis]UEA16605.1 LysE/ArgO family amino acid transporter [Pasteurella canis]UEC23044.1 LysE/ArgO family amino acid transporter [Pasteurella canis]